LGLCNLGSTRTYARFPVDASRSSIACMHYQTRGLLLPCPPIRAGRPSADQRRATQDRPVPTHRRPPAAAARRGRPAPPARHPSQAARTATRLRSTAPSTPSARSASPGGNTPSATTSLADASPSASIAACSNSSTTACCCAACPTRSPPSTWRVSATPAPPAHHPSPRPSRRDSSGESAAEALSSSPGSASSRGLSRRPRCVGHPLAPAAPEGFSAVRGSAGRAVRAGTPVSVVIEWRCRASQARHRERIRLTASIVATVSYNGWNPAPTAAPAPTAGPAARPPGRRPTPPP
jgi:hypothetical protein